MIGAVKAAIRSAKRREPVWMTERKRREMENHRIYVRAVRIALGCDPDAAINAKGTSYRKMCATW